ncbi:MAG TPA: Fic family protein [Thermoanaerobaculia bacterium]|nr:Fic family protein [Thermoanaerobaculia bacterium]
MRAGRYVKQLEGYRAFIPEPLPPREPPIAFDPELVALLSEADRALARLDGVGSILPNPDLFVGMYVRHEAVLSSQIEGTQSTLEDILQLEADGKNAALPLDVEEVVNYVRALNGGLARLSELPLSLRLIREVHAILMEGVRGFTRDPGEFRRTQNWIGPANCTLANASFVPPAVPAMHEALGAFELFLHDRQSLPPLIHCALAHAQFETIHPFLDGNGRVGRLLVTLLLCERAILARPLLYLSAYLKAHRAEYYDRLTAIRNDGDWEGWLKFFLRGVEAVSRNATATARAILALREQHRQALASNANAVRLLDYAFEHPILNVRMASRHLRCVYVTASSTIDLLVEKKILREVTGQKRNRIYRFDALLDLFRDQITGTTVAATEALT